MKSLSDDAHELVLFADSDGNLYRQRATPIIKNLMRKRKRGTFDASKSVQAWMHLANAASQAYKREIGDRGGRGSFAFDIGVRREAAHHWALWFIDMANDGQFDNNHFR